MESFPTGLPGLLLFLLSTPDMAMAAAMPISNYQLGLITFPLNPYYKEQKPKKKNVSPTQHMEV